MPSTAVARKLKARKRIMEKYSRSIHRGNQRKNAAKKAKS